MAEKRDCQGSLPAAIGTCPPKGASDTVDLTLKDSKVRDTPGNGMVSALVTAFIVANTVHARRGVNGNRRGGVIGGRVAAQFGAHKFTG